MIDKTYLRESTLPTFGEREFEAVEQAHAPSSQVHPTKSFLKVHAGLEFAYRERAQFALVTGPAGVGKSLAAKEYANRKSAAFIRCHPKFGGEAMIDAVDDFLSVTTALGGGLGGRVQHTLSVLDRRHHAMLIFDEAQNLRDDGLEMAKYLVGDDFDGSRCTLVFVMSDEFERRILKRKDMKSRILNHTKVTRLELSELQNLTLVDGFGEEVIEEIFNHTSGVMRDIIRLVRQLDSQVRANASKGMTREDIDINTVMARAGTLAVGLGGKE